MKLITLIISLFVFSPIIACATSVSECYNLIEDQNRVLNQLSTSITEDSKQLSERQTEEYEKAKGQMKDILQKIKSIINFTKMGSGIPEFKEEEDNESVDMLFSAAMESLEEFGELNEMLQGLDDSKLTQQQLKEDLLNIKASL